MERSGHFLESGLSFSNMRRVHSTFNSVRPGTKTFGLHARLTFKWFFENVFGVPCLTTSWVDRAGIEFRGRVKNEAAHHFHQLLELNQIYSLTDVSVFYVLYDDSRILNLRNATIDGESQISAVERHVFLSFSSLHYDYVTVPLAVEVMEYVSRLAIDVLGVFYGWIIEKESMRLITHENKILEVDVENAIDQIGVVQILHPCQTVVSLKGLRVDLEDADLLCYSCCSDTILTVGQNCPKSELRDVTEEWIRSNNECYD
ncbi:hypothetical protein DAPPUDRAFT_105105 [Daphnia pulex]|uniref:Uncharacterized protein n=1 Tax=Daphnia pulex TaxID=6669 RepID=E9GPH2_DAPPU|nr:hypothetical protein DAPPUDRAFT_105105 [Daphnia pulex]|eukprot:EFX78678.1 hypothetical protein DAPPUDRAFT_105105 [Daphnia pulex]